MQAIHEPIANTVDVKPDRSNGPTTQSITPVTNGQYWVIINDINDCESDTAFFTVNWISTSAAGIILTE